jgi:hypothetical protein
VYYLRGGKLKYENEFYVFGGVVAILGWPGSGL